MEKIAFYAVDGLYHFYRATAEGKFGSSIKESDAELIVKAVNNHDKLVERLKDVLDQIDSNDYSGGISDKTLGDIRSLLKHLESNPLT